jgi:enamine deaminase RidA (YjgF/YER057c/UK114 family)
VEGRAIKGSVIKGSAIKGSAIDRRTIGSGSPFEPVIGFSRASVAGRHVAVAGTAPVMPDGAEPPADAYGQTKRCLEIVLDALRAAGAGPEHVVRTRIFLVDAADWQEVGRAHGDVFADLRPASTMVVVAALLDPRWKVEIEADAILDD